MSRLPEHSIQTYTNKRFWPLDPRPDEVDILDIAHALSNSGRFTGHTRRFYSVAQHSVLVSRIVPREYALWGLLHDASEAYIADINRPAKLQMPEYKAIEKRLQRVIAERFGLSWPMPQEVHQADNVLLVTEIRDLMPKGFGYSLPPVRPLAQVIIPWLPDVAKRMFLERYRELTSPAQFRACADGSCNTMDDAVDSLLCVDGLCSFDREVQEESLKALVERLSNQEEV